MDITHFNGQRDRAWAVNMINLEARQMTSLATRLGDVHLQDGLSRLLFLKEIKTLIEKQLTRARNAKNNQELVDSFKELQMEHENLKEQDRLLRLKLVQVYADIELVFEDSKVVGYVISAVKVVGAGFTLFLGVSLMASANPIGMAAGAVLMIDGVNTLSAEINKNFRDKKESEGMFADQFISAASFLGFSPKTGLGVYRSVSLSASLYSVFGLAFKKPGSFILFRSLPSDFFRKFSKMSKPEITLKVVGWGLDAKIIHASFGPTEIDRLLTLYNSQVL